MTEREIDYAALAEMLEDRNQYWGSAAVEDAIQLLQEHARGEWVRRESIETVLDKCQQTEGSDEAYVFTYVIRDALRKKQGK